MNAEATRRVSTIIYSATTGSAATFIIRIRRILCFRLNNETFWLVVFITHVLVSTSDLFFRNTTHRAYYVYFSYASYRANRHHRKRSNDQIRIGACHRLCATGTYFAAIETWLRRVDGPDGDDVANVRNRSRKCRSFGFCRCFQLPFFDFRRMCERAICRKLVHRCSLRHVHSLRGFVQFVRDGGMTNLKTASTIKIEKYSKTNHVAFFVYPFR